MIDMAELICPIENKSKVEIYDDKHAELILSGGEKVMIDAEDATRCIEHKWYLNNNAIRATTDVNLTLNRFIMNAGPNDMVKHRDGNKLNCRKANLNKIAKGTSQSEEVLPSRITIYKDKGYAEIVVIRKGYEDKVAIIDLDDVDKCKDFIWKYGNDNVYCPKECNPLNKHMALHRYVTDAPEGKQVIYKDGNMFNCRKSNLLCMTHSEVQIYYKEINKSSAQPSDNKPVIAKPNKPAKPIATVSKPVTTKNYKNIISTEQGYIVLLQYEDKKDFIGIYDTKDEAVAIYEEKVIEIYKKVDLYGLYEEN
jgi:hypothetical protein